MTVTALTLFIRSVNERTNQQDATMLKPGQPQELFFGSYLYDGIVPRDHLLRKINAVVDFSFINDLVKDKYTPDFGRPAEDPEFMLRLCLLQYLYGDSDRQVIENARVNLAYNNSHDLVAEVIKTRFVKSNLSR